MQRLISLAAGTLGWDARFERCFLDNPVEPGGGEGEAPKTSRRPDLVLASLP
jgi:hypothetical protein